jgi:hypothetical protein
MKLSDVAFGTNQRPSHRRVNSARGDAPPMSTLFSTAQSQTTAQSDFRLLILDVPCTGRRGDRIGGEQFRCLRS